MNFYKTFFNPPRPSGTPPLKRRGISPAVLLLRVLLKIRVQCIKSLNFKSLNLLFSLLLFSLLLFFSCARQVMPSGGPRDTTPPKVVAEKPENGSVNFHGKIIKVTFDEYITLNNPGENVIFSPPLAQRVDYSTQGKSLIVKMNDTLRHNTTYNLLFSDCIQDFHEGNKLSGYNYAFATGDSIDKCKLFGKVENIHTQKPEPKCFVMLYEEDIDSLPLTKRPNYITKTNEQGEFIFHHLKPIKYKLFALKDINSDFIFNLPNELIAFSDSMYEAKCYASDSLFKADANASITMLLFQEADTVQTLSPYINTRLGLYRFPFKQPVKTFDFKMESDTAVDYFFTANETRDTLSLYLKSFFETSATAIITTDFVRMDTVELYPYKPPRSMSKNQKPVISKLSVTLSNNDALFLPTLLNFSYPLKPVDSVKILVIGSLRGKDTTSVFISVPDSFVMQLPVPFPFEPKINYNIVLKDSLFYGYDGTTHDTVNFALSKKTEKDYGNLFINYKIAEGADANFIVELLSPNQKLIQKDILSSSQRVEYKHLLPGNYKIKVTEDKNRNGKWDTGSYRKKMQPEKVFFIDKTITIRGFWDTEEDIELRVP